MAGLRTWLAERADGHPVSDLQWDAVAQWIRKKKWTPEENKRRAYARKRHEYFAGRGESYMRELIEKVHKDRDVIDLRKQWVEVAKHVNVLRRLFRMLSTTYSVPAKRTVAGEGNANYQEVQRQSRQHGMAKRWCRWGNLHAQLVVGSRVRESTRGVKEPVIDIVPPSQFWALASPIDATRLLALGLELDTDHPVVQRDAPKWLVMTDHEQLLLNEQGFILPGSIQEHGWDRMPYLLLSVDPPIDGLIDAGASSSAVSAHESVWFQHVLLAKESKSATKMPVVTGDVTSAARKQALDSERPWEVSDGTTVAAVNLGMDLEQFRANANYIYEGAAADHDLPPQLLHHAGVQSAEARELMRAPLKETRRDQEIYWREFEREFVEIQSMVIKRHMPSLAFDTEGHRVDFTETTTALDPKTEAEVFEHLRRLGLTNSVKQIMKQNPDLDEEGAWREMLLNIEVELARVRVMKPLQQLSGGMGTSIEPKPPSPEGDDTTEAGRGLRAVTPTETGDEATPAIGRRKQRRDAR